MAKTNRKQRSDTPTRAKNCEASYSNEQEKTRKTEIGSSEPQMLDTGFWIPDAERIGKKKTELRSQ